MNQGPTSVLVLKATPYQATNGLALILMNVQVILELLPVDNLIIVSTLEEVCALYSSNRIRKTQNDHSMSILSM